MACDCTSRDVILHAYMHPQKVSNSILIFFIAKYIISYIYYIYTKTPNVEATDLAPILSLKISLDDDSALCCFPVEKEVNCWHIVKEYVVEVARDFFCKPYTVEVLYFVIYCAHSKCAIS